jgi:hypothetical protein
MFVLFKANIADFGYFYRIACLMTKFLFEYLHNSGSDNI